MEHNKPKTRKEKIKYLQDVREGKIKILEPITGHVLVTLTHVYCPFRKQRWELDEYYKLHPEMLRFKQDNEKKEQNKNIERDPGGKDSH